MYRFNINFYLLLNKICLLLLRVPAPNFVSKMLHCKVAFNFDHISLYYRRTIFKTVRAIQVKLIYTELNDGVRRLYQIEHHCVV